MRTWLVVAVTSACAAGTSVADVAHEAQPANSAPIHSAALSLAPGEVVELAPGPRGVYGARIATPRGDEQFIIVVGSTSFAPGQGSFDYELSLAEAGNGGPARVLTGCSLDSGSWRDAELASEPAPRGPAPELSSTRTFNVPTPTGNVDVSARLLAIGEHSAIWADSAHAASLDAAFVSQFLDEFERVILPRSRQIFGTEPDIDGNGRIQLVFSPLTRERGVAFFTGCDLEPLPGCTGSNVGEYLYLTTPDAIDPPYNTPNAIKEILTHELAHLLHFNRKVLRNDLETWVDGLFLSEGIGALAQDVVGYQAGNLYVTKAGLDGIGDFSLAGVFDVGRREERVDGVMRGGAYLFARYVYDRAGGDAVSGVEVQNRGGPALWRALLEAREPVGVALSTVAGSAEDLAMDFYSALAFGGREHVGGAVPRNPCFSFLATEKDPVTQKQRGTSPFASFHGMRMTGPALGSARAPDGKLRAGGVEYLAIEAAEAGGELGFELRADSPARARVRIGRWK